MHRSFYIDSNYSRFFKTSDLRTTLYYGHFIAGHLLKTFAFLHDNNLLDGILNNDITLYMNKVNELNMEYYRGLIGDNIYRSDNCPSGVDKVFLTENNDNGYCFSESELLSYPTNYVIWTNKKHFKYFSYLREFVVKKYGYREPVNFLYASRKKGQVTINGKRTRKWIRYAEFDNEINVVNFLEELAKKNNLMFKNVHFPDISVRDRIILSLESKIMFGFFGAQLFNAIFQPKDSLFIEFNVKDSSKFRKCCRIHKNICKNGDNLPLCCFFNRMAEFLNYKYLKINASNKNRGLRERAIFKENHKIIINRFIEKNLLSESII